MRKLDVASGSVKEDGWERIDRSDAFDPDYIHDITEFPWPFDDDTFDELRCCHILEHIERRLLVPVMNEMHRIIKPHGILEIVVPTVADEDGQIVWQAFADPTHVSFFVPQTFAYFVAEGYADHQKLYGIKLWEQLEMETTPEHAPFKYARSEDGALIRCWLAKPWPVAEKETEPVMAGVA